jgi:hypothetical protein
MKPQQRDLKGVQKPVLIRPILLAETDNSLVFIIITNEEG